MNFADNLRNIRKQSGMSQEKLAERLGVSRQAVTKWESGGGIPDIENIISIASLFRISIEELLSVEKELPIKDYLFESVTEYDIDTLKDYDMNLGGAYRIVLSAYDGEKLKVRLVSHNISTLQQDIKLKIDDNRRSIDLDIIRLNDLSEMVVKKHLYMFIQLPQKYLSKIEINSYTTYLEIHSLESEKIEIDGKVTDILLDHFIGDIEINNNLDMNMICQSLNGAVEINQISSSSKIFIPQDTHFQAVKKGINNRIYFENIEEEKEAENIIELNGIKSELFICSLND